jgi:HEAT repeat protein
MKHYERKDEMYQMNIDQNKEVMDQLGTFASVHVAIEVQMNDRAEELLTQLSPENPWGDRQMAARELGYMGCSEAVPALLNALPNDSFWMVRCAIIQALERIGDPGAISTLRDVAERDGFRVVRSYAAKAIERLSVQ